MTSTFDVLIEEPCSTGTVSQVNPNYLGISIDILCIDACQIREDLTVEPREPVDLMIDAYLLARREIQKTKGLSKSKVSRQVYDAKKQLNAWLQENPDSFRINDVRNVLRKNFRKIKWPKTPLPLGRRVVKVNIQKALELRKDGGKLIEIAAILRIGFGTLHRALTQHFKLHPEDERGLPPPGYPTAIIQFDIAQAQRLKEQGYTLEAISKTLGISKTTLFRALKRPKWRQAA